MAAPASKRGGPASTATPPPSAAAAGLDPIAHERWCWILVALIGQPVTATLKDGVRVTGILAAATPDAGDLSIALRQAVTILPASKRDTAAAAAPPKPALVLNGKDLVQLEAQDTDIDFVGHAALPPQRPQSSASSTPAAATDSFRTDTDISRASQLGKERQLQAWGTDAGYGGEIEDGDAGSGLEDGLGRSVNGNGKGNTGRRGGGGGPGSSSNGGGGAWDQFAANERAFGLRTDYDDEIYTTRLDRSTADFKQREARAAQLEREILKGSSTSSTSLAYNAHVAEERGEQVADSLDEEERYGAVIRTGTEGAYVPPGARKAALARLQQQNGGQGQGFPGGAGSGSSGTASPAPPPASSLSASTPATAAPVAPTTSTTTKPNPNAKPYDRSMQEFVHSERVRLEQRRAQMQQAQQQSQQQAQLKKEHDSKLASLVQWSQTFKNPYPMPDEVAQILGKKPVTGGATTTTTATAESKTTAAAKSATVSPATATTALPATSAATVASPKASAAATGKPIAPTTTTKITKAMVLEIPPFDPNRAKAKQAALLAAQKAGTAPAAPAAAAATVPAASASGTAGTTAPSTSTEAKPPAGGAKKLSATSAAFVFKPNPAAASFTPGASNTATATTTAAGAAAASARRPSATSTTASAVESAPTPKVPVNPFFGTKQIKKGSSSMHVKEDFTPFKNGVPPEPSTVPPTWPFTGKSYRSIYPIPPQGPLDDVASGMIDPNNAAAIAAAQQQAHAHAGHAFIGAAGGVPINMLQGPQHPPMPPQQQQQQQQQPFVAMSSGGGSMSGSPAPMPMPPPPPPHQAIAGGGPHLQHPHPHPHQQPQPQPQQFGMYGGGGGGGGHAPPPASLAPPHHHQFAQQQQFSPAAAAAMAYARQPGGSGGSGGPPPPPQQQQQQMAHMNAPGPGPQFQPHHGQQPHHPPPPPFFGQPAPGAGGGGGGGSHLPGFVPGPNQGHPPHGAQMLSSPHMPHAAVHSPRMSVSTQGGRGPPQQQQQQQPPMPWTPPPPPPFQQTAIPIPNGGPPPPPPHVQGGPGGFPPPQ